VISDFIDNNPYNVETANLKKIQHNLFVSLDVYVTKFALSDFMVICTRESKLRACVVKYLFE
jgi:hypothetical protein